MRYSLQRKVKVFFTTIFVPMYRYSKKFVYFLKKKYQKNAKLNCKQIAKQTYNLPYQFFNFFQSLIKFFYTQFLLTIFIVSKIHSKVYINMSN